MTLLVISLVLLLAACVLMALSWQQGMWAFVALNLSSVIVNAVNIGRLSS